MSLGGDHYASRTSSIPPQLAPSVFEPQASAHHLPRNPVTIHEYHLFGSPTKHRAKAPGQGRPRRDSVHSDSGDELGAARATTPRHASPRSSAHPAQAAQTSPSTRFFPASQETDLLEPPPATFLPASPSGLPARVYSAQRPEGKVTIESKEVLSTIARTEAKKLVHFDHLPLIRDLEVFLHDLDTVFRDAFPPNVMLNLCLVLMDGEHINTDRDQLSHIGVILRDTQAPREVYYWSRRDGEPVLPRRQVGGVWHEPVMETDILHLYTLQPHDTRKTRHQLGNGLSNRLSPELTAQWFEEWQCGGRREPERQTQAIRLEVSNDPRNLWHWGAMREGARDTQNKKDAEDTAKGHPAKNAALRVARRSVSLEQLRQLSPRDLPTQNRM